GQITGISSSSQELSPRRKIRRGLFASDKMLSGNALPREPNLTAAANRWADGHGCPAGRRAPCEADGQAELDRRFHAFAQAILQALAFKHLKPTQPSPRGAVTYGLTRRCPQYLEVMINARLLSGAGGPSAGFQ